MADELMNMTLDEAMPLTRALGHYLGLTSIAELHHRYGHFTYQPRCKLWQ